MILETVDISDISQDPANVRKHSDRNLEAIAASLRAFGQQKPIVVDKRGVILAGNGTYEAAKRIGWDKIQITRTDLSGTMATAYAIADNRTAELAEWDDTALAEQLRALQSEEFDLANVGYTDDEVQQLIDGIGNEILGDSEVTEDEIPEPPIEPITKPGDLWLLGEHRLLCGDSTNPDDVNRLMNGEKADLCLTDPPYGVSYADKNSFLNAIDKGNRNQTQIENDHLSKSDSQKLWKDSFQQMFNSMKPGACIYCFMPQGGDQMMMMMMMMMESGIEPKHELIWLKNNHVLGRTDYAYKHEPILYAWKKGGHKFYGEFQTSVLEFPRPQKSDLHPTMKPVNLISKLISNSSMDNHVVFDPFLGSGTTLIAAEQIGRKCYGMEISPQYCDVIVKRWETLTGRVATRA